MTTRLAVMALLFLGFGQTQSHAQILFNYTNDSLGIPASVAVGASASNLNRGAYPPGIRAATAPCGPTQGYGSNGWPTTNVFDVGVFNANGDYVEFTLTPAMGNGLKITGFSAKSRRENYTGTANDGPLAIRYGFKVGLLGAWTTVNPGNPQSSNVCSSGGSTKPWLNWNDTLITETITFRIYGLSSGSSGTGKLYLRDIVVTGEVCASVPSIALDLMNSDLQVCRGETNGILAYSAVDASSYSISWDMAAQAQGFVNVGSTALAAAPDSIDLAIPAAAAPGNYSGVLTVSNGCGFSSNYPFSVTVWALPSAVLSGDQEICEGDFASLEVALTGASPWNLLLSDSTGYVGLTGSTLGGLSPDETTVYTVIYLSDANGCVAEPDSLDGSATVTVIERPHVAISLSATAICDDGEVTLTFTDNAATGHTFSILADLVHDFGTVAEAINYSNIPSGASDIYTEGIDFEGSTGDTVWLVNILVTDETTNCDTVLPDLVLVINPLPVGTATPAVDSVCSGGTTAIALSSNVPGTTFEWEATVTSGTVSGQADGSGSSIAQTLSGNGIVRYRVTPTGPAPTNCEGSFFDVFITVLPEPQFAFSAQVGAHPVQSDDNFDGPGTVTLDFCSGESFCVDLDSITGSTLFLEQITGGTGNLLYDVTPIPATRDTSVQGPGFFSGCYGPYNLAPGETFGQIVQVFTPFLDVINPGVYDEGVDCLGDPITLIYNVYGPIVINVVRNANNLCSGDQASYTISTTSDAEILFDLTFDETTPGTAVLNDDNTLPITLTDVSLSSLASFDFDTTLYNEAGSFDRGRMALSISNVRYANTDIVCSNTINIPQPNTLIYPTPRLENPGDKVICTGGSTDLDIDLDSLNVNGAGAAGFPVRIEWTVSATNVLGASNGIDTIYNATGTEISLNDIVQTLTLDDPNTNGSVTYTITPRASASSNAFNGDDCFGDPITVTITVVRPAEPEITGLSCVYVGSQTMLTANNGVLPPAEFVGGVWTSTPNVTLIDTFSQDTVLVTGYIGGDTAYVYYTVTDDAGCSSVDTFLIEVLEELTLTSSYNGDPIGCGDEFTITVTADDFCDIGTLDYFFNWNINDFQFVTHTVNPIAGGFADVIVVNTNIGELGYSFFATDPPFGVGLPDGTVLFTYTLRAIGNQGVYNVPAGVNLLQAYNSSFVLVPTSATGLSIPVEGISLDLLGNPVVCPSDDFAILEYDNVQGNPDHFVIDFDGCAGFPDTYTGPFNPNGSQIAIPLPNGLLSGSCNATLVLSNTEYGCESDVYNFSIIIDQESPTASAPDMSFYSCTWQVPAPNVNIIDDEADNCSGIEDLVVAYEPALSDTIGSGCGLDTMFISRAYSITDEAGNDTVVYHLIKVVDNIAPTIDTDLPSAWYQDGEAAIAAAVAHANATKEDNCSIPIEISVTVGAVDTGGCVATIQLIVTDACGNAAQLSNTLVTTTIDRENPTIDNPGPLDDCYGAYENPDSLFQYAIETAITAVAAVANDDCTDPEDLVITAETSGFDCSLTIVVTVADACGKETTHTYQTRVDSEPPIISTDPGVMDGMCFETEEEARDSAIAKTIAGDNCGDASVQIEIEDVSIGCPAEITVLVTDSCGNPSYITYYGLYIDTEDPTVDPEPIYETCYQTQEDAFAGLADAANPSDNCSTEAELIESAQPQIIGEDPCDYTVRITFTDHCGRDTFIEFTGITIEDEAPTAEALPDLEYACVSEVDAPDTGIIVAEDNCGVQDIEWIADTLPESCPGTGKRHYRITDCAGNYYDLFQNIIINDDVAPTWLVGPGLLDITCECATNPACLAYAQSMQIGEDFLEAEDNCGEWYLVRVAGSFVPNPNCANDHIVGTYTNTWYAVDSCGTPGNQSEPYIQTITIVDNTAPNWVTLPNELNANVECDDTEELEAALELQPVADEDCTDVTYEMISRTYTDYGGCYMGTKGYWYTEWTATDDCGNSSTIFGQYVYVFDTTAPVWQTPEGVPFPNGLNATIQCDDQDAYDFFNSLVPNVLDNCDAVLDTVKVEGPFVPTGDCPGEGTFTNTWTVSDSCGNVSTVFTQVISVTDSEAPTFQPGCQFMPLNLFTTDFFNPEADCSLGISLEVGDELSSDSTWTVAGVPIAPLGTCIDDNCTPYDQVIAEVVSIVDESVDTLVSGLDTFYCVRQITVSFELRDLCDNVQEELFVCVYNIIDNTAPELFCPMRSAGGGPTLPDNCYATAEDAEQAALELMADYPFCISDNCTDFEDLVIETSTEGDCNATVTVSVSDCAHNTSYYYFSTRIDSIRPTMEPSEIATCYPDTTTALAAAVAGTTISDNCSDIEDIDVNVEIDGACPATITITATDECGNSRTIAYSGICIGASGDAEITVEAQNQSVDCVDWQDDLEAWLADNGGAEATGSGLDWSYLPLDPATVLSMSAPNCSTHSKSVAVTFRVTDGCGYFDETTATFSVTDNIPPTANSIPNTSLSCVADTAAPNINLVTGVSDNCGGTPVVTLFANTKSGTGCPGSPLVIGRTYAVTDEYCNTTYVTHMITVVDNTPPTFTAPANTTVNVDANCNYNATVGATGDVTDESDNCTPSGPGLQATYTESIVPGTPGPGNPELYVITRTWRLFDACGNEAIPRVQTIYVHDVTPPTLGPCPAAQNLGGSAILLEGQTVCAALVGLTAPAPLDNCPGATVSYELSGATEGSGPGGPSGYFYEGETVVVFTVTDAAGNTATCSTTITVNCLTVSGRLKWEHDDATGINNATVTLTPTMPLVSDLSDNSGDYELAVPAAGSYTITPVKNTGGNLGRMNGVSTADATAITNHINGTVIITDPYKKVCADVNRSNIINTQDVTLINQCLAGNPTAQAIFNVFWRFTPTSFVWPAAPDRFTIPAFPETRAVTVAASDITAQDFFGMKIGDVNGTAVFPAPSPELSPLVWVLQDQTLMAGTDIELTFAASNFTDFASYQLALDFDPTQLKFAGFQPMEALPMNLLDNFGAYNADLGELRNVWSSGNGVTLADGTQIFRVKFKVLATGKQLSEVLQLDESQIDCRAFSKLGQPAGMRLVFAESVGADAPLDPAGLRLQLLQNRPNPFHDATTIGFILPEACEAQIRILDISGRVLTTYDRTYTAGYHELDFRMENAASYGVLFCELITPKGTRMIKMVTTGK